MSFASHTFLWLTLVLGSATAAFLWWSWRRKQEAAERFVGSRLYAQLTIGVSKPLQILRRGLIALAVFTILVAVARPRWGFIDEETSASGLDVVVAFDVSRSMLASDAKPNRLEKARRAALDLVESSQADRLGLVAFAGDAFLQAPLTLDDDAFRQSVRALDTDIIPVQGTGLAAALRESRAAFGKDSTGAKAIVVITDGEDHEPGAVEVAKELARDGIRIFTLGVGTSGGAVLQTSDPYGNPIFIKDQQGNAVKSRLNEDLLRQVADAGGGFYLPLQNRQTIQNLYDQGLGPLPRSVVKAGRSRQWIERFQWPLGLGILLLIAEVLVPEHRRAVARRTNAGMIPSANTPAHAGKTS